MLRTIHRVTIYQAAVTDNPNKSYALQFYSMHSFTSDSSWDNISQKAKLTLQRRIKKIGYVIFDINDYKACKENIQPNIIAQNITKNKTYLNIDKSSTTIINVNPKFNTGSIYNSDGYRTNPLIQRGDIISVETGYIIYDKTNDVIWDTIDTGNVGNIGTFTQKLPENYDLEGFDDNGNFKFNVNDRWRPANRALIFKGYIAKSGIDNDGNIFLDLEDYMYLFNRARIPNKIYDPNAKNAYDYHNSKAVRGWTLKNIISDMVINITNGDKLPIGVLQPVGNDGNINLNLKGSVSTGANIDSQLGVIKVENSTIGKFFEFLKNEYNFPVFFRSNTDILVTNPFIYNDFTYGEVPKFDADAGFSLNGASTGQEEFTFIMGEWTLDAENIAIKNNLLKSGYPPGYYRNKQNIIKANLEFKRDDDVPMGATIKSIFKTNLVDSTMEVIKTSDGRGKKNLVELTRHVGDYGGTDLTFMYLSTSETKDMNPDGTPNVPVLTKNMDNFGAAMLKLVNFTGLKGSFSIGGYPYVQFCDIVNIVDLSFPERSGRYYVKQVIYKVDSNDGNTQEVFIDYRLPNKNVNQ